MTEHDARQWIDERFGPAAVDKLDTFASMVIDESHRQNLIAPSTIPAIWTRHLLDSAQLVPLAPPVGLWVDIGTGAGFPGLVAAILRPEATILVEPRRQRAIFLERCVAALRLERVEVRSVKIEQLVAAAAVISARAVGPVEKLLQGGAGCATNNTRWLLPRGRLVDELAALQARWTGLFHMKQSITDPQSMILICEGPTRR